jgi:hypothetical protein
VGEESLARQERFESLLHSRQAELLHQRLRRALVHHRRTLLELLARESRSNLLQKRMLGWMSRRMIETYSHTRMEAKRRVVAGFDLLEENSPGRNSQGTKVGTVQ